ncbi:hypothetical protein K493DRAFT_412597 [Basidiobolus meristosporus CBS 931.73]|uniref:Chromo domain-containing protein n=1 Tax=Basidiobolus meristosporus CBS 931.73 TaxID=1314790 RepID=A0A1Y1WQW2_9FUNG|nr:hypothetical protein K493DRAFT_412597 [Basidiobolus meristosporus CBS 931.73]|eukprot:ORX75862.1 hypothetical protein K493DRAFT_412597 [Basidiobolus meristosporus CBS 931.73]
MTDWLDELSSDDSLKDFIVGEEDQSDGDYKQEIPKNNFEVEIITPRRSKLVQVSGKNDSDEEEDQEEEEDEEEGSDEAGDNEWEVEDIMKQKIVKKEEWYLIKWRGYDELTWEPLDHLNCPELLQDFLDRSGLKSVYFESDKEPSTSSHPQIATREKSQRISNKNAGGFSSVAKFKSTLAPSKSKAKNSTEAPAGYKRKHGYDASALRSETELEYEKQLRERENLIQTLNSQYASLPRFKKARGSIPSTPRRVSTRPYEKESVLPTVIPNHSISPQTAIAQASSKEAEPEAAPQQERASVSNPLGSIESSPPTRSPVRKPPFVPERSKVKPGEIDRSPKTNPIRDSSQSPKINNPDRPKYTPKANPTQGSSHPPNTPRAREPDSLSHIRARESAVSPMNKDSRKVIMSKSVSDPRKPAMLSTSSSYRDKIETGATALTPQSTAEAMFGSVPLFSKSLANSMGMSSDSDSSDSLGFNGQERSLMQKPGAQSKTNQEHSADWICRLYKGKSKEVGLVRVGLTDSKDTKLLEIMKDKNSICFSKTIRCSYVKPLVDQAFRNNAISTCYVHLANRDSDEQKLSRFTSFLAREGLVGITTYKNLVVIASPMHPDIHPLFQNPSDNLSRVYMLLINDPKLAKDGLHYDQLLPRTVEFTSKWPITPANLHHRTWESLLGFTTECPYSQVSIFGPENHPEVLSMEALLKDRNIPIDATMKDPKTNALLIHRSSLSQIHMIPSLNDLKQREPFAFIVFGFAVNISPEQALPSMVFPSGGIVTVTTELLLANDRILHKLMEYKDLKRYVEKWRIVISDSTLKAIRAEAANHHATAIKSCQIVEDLIRSERIKCIGSNETKPDAEAQSGTIGMMLKLQGLLKAECRHFIVLTTKETMEPSRLGVQFVEPPDIYKWFNLEKL